VPTPGDVPAGYHTVNPYIVVEGVETLLHFLRVVFGATELGEREVSEDGRIDHAEVQIGDSVVMVSEASPVYPARPSVFFVYVPNVDTVFLRAQSEGVSPILEPTVQPWGDRVAGFHDHFQNRWWVATRVTP